MTDSLLFFFNMGLIRKVSFEEYWNKHSPSQSTPWFRCMFSRNQFQNILKFLHLVDTKTLPNPNDPAYKPSQRFKPLLDFGNRKFLRYYNSRRELAVDESLVGTKGKTSMLQYIPSKRSRFGLKFWMLVESVTVYVLQMDVYHGKRFDPTPAGTLQGTNVVINLMKNSHLLGKGFHVFADNFFASLNLANKLLRERTYLTGTMRTNRPTPQMIKNACPQAGNAVYARQRQIMLCCFRDHNRKNPVTLVSTYYNAIDTLNGKPRIIGAYNTFMGGVDLSDQMIGAYNDHRKCSKVWKKIIYHIFNRIMLNEYILYSHNTSLPVMS
ncbi:piggyBac transposable element-derived protein 4-like [Mytilus californianus]|uniref:piggyBac transposable element-derived protein 4-like n=1 Tax=Mytilus californianus TaxID=6549 RepID=UPI002247B9BB|nr:piggyBac transposable element-derived protein 4-like [Mytilus californianus]